MPAHSHAIVVATFVAVAATLVAPELRVQPDKENIVSNLIEGTWISDDALNQRLGSREKDTRLEFMRDDGFATKIPAKYEEHLGKKTLFTAGTMTWREGERLNRFPYVVVEMSGNPHLVNFRQRGDDPLGDAESCNVMLVRGSEREKDLLFLGGDTARETFRAFRRELPQPR